MPGLGRKKIGTIMNLLTLKCFRTTQLGCSLAVEGTLVGNHKRRQDWSKQLWGSPTERACSREECRKKTGRKNCTEEFREETVKEGSSR